MGRPTSKRAAAGSFYVPVLGDVDIAIEGRAIEGRAIEGRAIEGRAIEGRAIGGRAIGGRAIALVTVSRRFGCGSRKGPRSRRSHVPGFAGIRRLRAPSGRWPSKNRASGLSSRPNPSDIVAKMTLPGSGAGRAHRPYPDEYPKALVLRSRGFLGGIVAKPSGEERRRWCNAGLRHPDEGGGTEEAGKTPGRSTVPHKVAVISRDAAVEHAVRRGFSPTRPDGDEPRASRPGGHRVGDAPDGRSTGGGRPTRWSGRWSTPSAPSPAARRSPSSRAASWS